LSTEFQILPPKDWDLVAPIVTGVHHNEMPLTERQAIFYCLRDEGRLLGFTHIESLLHVSSLWVTPELRGSRVGWELAKATDDLLRRMPGFSTIAFPENERVAYLFERLGGRSLGSIPVWRKDY
jgi:RimJ/RimL family protein N-acetyltransferase